MKFLIALILLTVAVNAQNHTGKNIEYYEGSTLLEGYVVYPDDVKGKAPVVILVHEWTGINDHVKMRAGMLAEMGYIAFAADIYGKGIRPQTPQDAGKEAGKYKGNRPLLRARINAALAEAKKLTNADINNIAAIGFCFGGTTVLELARDGADVKGVVSFHGGLDNPTPQTNNIKAKILVLHGGDDPYVSKEEFDGFVKEMQDSKADWQLFSYGGAVHSFTNVFLDTDNSKGAAYNEKAATRSWKAMKTFFDEIFTKN